VEEDVGLLEFHAHLLGIGHEVGAEITAVELHALDDIELGLAGLGFLDGDDPVITDLLHCLSDHLADRAFTVGRNGADLGDLIVAGDLACVLLEIGHDRVDGEVDAALEIHRVHTRSNGLGAFADNSLRENGCRCGAVAGVVVGLGRHFAHHLGAHVLELVGKLDFLGDGHAVLGDAGRAEALFDHDIAALWTQRDLHRIRENVDATQHPVARVEREFDFLSSHFCSSLLET
jgi:hypothetical protein